MWVYELEKGRECVYAREREREKGEEHVCVLNSIFKKQKTIKSSSFLLPTTHNNKNFIQKRKLRKSGEPCHGNNYKLRVSSKTNKLPVSGAHIINQLTLAWYIPRLFYSTLLNSWTKPFHPVKFCPNHLIPDRLETHWKETWLKLSSAMSQVSWLPLGHQGISSMRGLVY